MWDKLNLNDVSFGMMIELRNGRYAIITSHPDFRADYRVVAYEGGGWDHFEGKSCRWDLDGSENRDRDNSRAYDIVKVYSACFPWKYDSYGNIWSTENRTLLYSSSLKDRVNEPIHNPIKPLTYGVPYYSDYFKEYESAWQLTSTVVNKPNKNKSTILTDSNEDEIPYPF